MKNKKNMVFVAMMSLGLALFSPQSATAQSSGEFSGGSVKIGYDSQTCTGSIEGAVRYNSSNGIEFCDGSSWANAGGACYAPASCPNVGDVCADGSLFAGFMFYNDSCEALYVTDDNQSTATQWKTATGTNDITDAADRSNYVDGQYNRDNRGGGTFPAFELCEDNPYHGKSDWYLPARAELHLLWLNQTAIEANAAENFATGPYWSSTEISATTAADQTFAGGGFTGNVLKTNSSDVRCVRRD